MGESQTPGEISEIEVPPGKSLKRYGKYIPSVGVRLVSDMRFCGTGTAAVYSPGVGYSRNLYGNRGHYCLRTAF